MIKEVCNYNIKLVYRLKLLTYASVMVGTKIIAQRAITRWKARDQSTLVATKTLAFTRILCWKYNIQHNGKIHVQLGIPTIS